MTTRYIEVSTVAEANALEDRVGKALAAQRGKPWPEPPDVVGPGKYPGGLVVRAWTPYASLPDADKARVPKQPRPLTTTTDYSRGVLVAISDESATLLDGDTVDGEVLDLSVAKLERDLSTEAKTALQTSRTADEPAAEVERVR